MKLSVPQQIFDLVNKSNNLLIALTQNPSTDAIAGALALKIIFEKKDKKVKVVSQNYSLSPQHSFLPKSQDIHSELTTLRQFIVSLDVSKTKVEELSYDIGDDKLNIFIKPKNGFFKEENLSTSAGQYEYDLIFVIDAPELEALGNIYDNNTEFFYFTPIINIDHKASNDNFGQVNLVDITATSVSEIVFELIKEHDEKLLDEYIATNLLAGIISKTKSFQTPQVTPKSLAIASHLIASGARREEIIRNLYQTKSLSTLRLWGRTLARLQTAASGRIIWSLIKRDDFQKTDASEADLDGVIDELIINTPTAEIIALIYETSNQGVVALISTQKHLDGFKIFSNFNPLGNKDFTKISFPQKTLTEAEKMILEKAEAALRI